MATLTLPQLNILREKAASSRLWREQAHQFERATHVVEAHWNELPYQIRLSLAEISHDLDRHLPEPMGFGRRVRLSFSRVWDTLTGDEYSTRWALAYAGLVAAVRVRLIEELAADKASWEQSAKDNPEFHAAYERGLEALKKREFVEADWKTLQPRISA